MGTSPVIVASSWQVRTVVAAADTSSARASRKFAIAADRR